jgi:RHS repeat-associated protein
MKRPRKTRNPTIMVSRATRSLALLVLIAAASCAEQSGQPHRTDGDAQGRGGQAAETKGSDAQTQHEQHADLTDLQVYERVKASVPDDVRQLATATFEHAVRADDALQEFQSLARVVATSEIRGLATAESEPQGSSSRMFADWARIQIAGTESLQELDTDQSPRSGPDREVLLHNGELRFQQIDHSLPSRSGLGFTFARVYRSHVDYDGPLGPGWDHNHNQRLIVDGDSSRNAKQIAWYSGQRRVLFHREGDGWVAEAGGFYRLSITDAQAVIETPLLNRLIFERALAQKKGAQTWRIKTIATRHDAWRANTLRYAYDGDRLSSVVDPFGNEIRLRYYTNGKLRELCHGSFVVRYAYDRLGRLNSATTQAVAHELEKSVDVVQVFGYEQFGGKDRPWLVTAIPPGGGPKQVIDYEREVASPDFGQVRELRFVKDAQSNTPLAAWKFNRLRNASAKPCTVTVQVTPPAPLPIETYTYRTTGSQDQPCQRFPTARAVPSRHATWTTDYNKDGLPTEETLPLGGKRKLEYDAGNPCPLFHGNLLAEHKFARPGPNVLGIVEIGTIRKYHPKIALPIEENAYETAVGGKRRVLRSLTWDYDDRDLDLACSRVGRQCTIQVRNRYGLVVADFDGAGIASLYRYFEEFGEGTVGINRGGLLAECVRDISPERVQVELRTAGVTPSATTKAPNRVISATPVAQSTQYAYDVNGLPVREQHKGYDIRSLYNKMGLLLCRYDMRGDLQVLEYNRSLRKTAEYRRTSSSPDAEYKGEARPGIKGRFYKQRFAYDGMGYLESWVPTEELLGRDGKTPPVVNYARYPSGAIKTRTTPGGNVIELVYEEATGYLRKKTLASNQDVNKRLTLQRDISYDAEGFQDGYVDDLDQEHTFKPDSFGRPFSYTSPDRIERQTFLDGLDRPVRRTGLNVRNGNSNNISESTLSYDAEGNLEIERIRRIGKGVDANGKDAAIDEWLTSGQFRYDAAGNRTHARSTRKDAWTRLEYDGLRRLVLKEDAVGDTEAMLYENDSLVLRSHHVKNQATGQISKVCDVSLLDSNCRPWLLVRVGSDGRPAFSRSVVQLYDSQGRRVQTATPGLTRQVTILDSLDRPVKETSIPLATRYDEKPKCVDSRYDGDGHLTRRTVQNSPMAVFTDGAKAPGPTANGPVAEARIEPARVLVPQTMIQAYDEFGRLWKTTMPDGLERENKYNAGSMVETITLTHAEDKKFREVVRLEYDPLRRVLAVKDDKDRMPIPIQNFKYDDFGNVIFAEDHGNPRCPVTVNRRFDNLGNILCEETTPGDGPRGVKVAYEYAPAEGTQGVRLLGVGQRKGQWQQMVSSSDPVGRTASIAVDGDSTFCQYKYVGSQIVRKTLAQGGIELGIDTSPLLEPLAYSFRELGSGAVVCRADYRLDSHGLVTASTAEVRQKQWQRSQFYQHDSLGNLVGEIAEDRLCPNPEQRRKTVLNDLTCPGAWRTRWSRYDEAGNLITTFRKKFAQTNDDVKNGDRANVYSNDAQYYSPSQPFRAPLADVNDPKVAWKQASEAVKLEPGKMLDLASNRLATIASRQKVVQEFEFDSRGRLTKFPSTTDGRSLTWHVKYDLLGRATEMRGCGSGKEKGKPDIELLFASDVFNRRVRKEVHDYSHTDTTVTVTTYLGGEPVIVMKRGGDKSASWDVAAQYLWGPAAREAIMAVLPADKVEQRPTQEWGRYFLHQDRMLNVFLCTGLKENKVEVFDIASFWGFGENSTTGNVASIDSTASSEHGNNPSLAIDKALDEKRGSWLGGDASDRITLGLDRSAQMSEMTIWTDNFPKAFRVYVVPDGEDAKPSREKLAAWEDNAQKNGWIVCRSDRVQRQDDLQDPYKIPLMGREGKSIVIAWDKATSLSAREFEVSIVPRNPSCLAFAGQWLDKETGLYYQGARYRLPTMGGKFICPDPLGFLDGDNLYAYAHNDPLSWHDPDGKFAHILAGGGVGAALGGGAYVFQVWMTGEEFSWAKLGIYTAAGGASGALTAATFGAASAYLGTGLAAEFLAGGAAGGVGGVGHGLIASGGITWLETGSLSQGAVAGLHAAAVEGAMGFVGGGFGGAALGQLSRGPALNFIGNKVARGLTTSVIAGGVGGGGAGAVGGAYEGYMDGGWDGVLSGSMRGAGRGALTGAAGGAMAFGIGKGIDVWRGGSRDGQWRRAQRDYWRRAAQSAQDDPGRYSPDDLSRMQRGRAPQTISPKTGLLEPTELHHNTLPQRSGLPGSVINEDWNLLPVSPQEHSAIDPFRHY